MTTKLLLFKRREAKKGTARKRRVDEGEPDQDSSSTLAEIREKQQLRANDRRGTPIDTLAGQERPDMEQQQQPGKKSKFDEEMEQRFDKSATQGDGAVPKLKPGLAVVQTKPTEKPDATDGGISRGEAPADVQSSKETVDQAALSAEDQLYIVKPLSSTSS